MGIAASASVSTVVQRAVTTTYQRAQNLCTANCSQLISGNVIVLDNTTAGDITFTQRCEADASCYMENSLDALVEAFQEAETVADAKPAFFPGIQVNVSVASTVQEINNELTQIMENLCTADVDQNLQENIVYATDSDVGNIGFLQEGNASASCVMENVGRLTAQMRQDGSATAASGGSYAGIIGAVITVVIIIVIIYAIVQFNKNKSTKKDPFAQQALSQSPVLSGGSRAPSNLSSLATQSNFDSLNKGFSSLSKTLRRGRA